MARKPRDETADPVADKANAPKRRRGLGNRKKTAGDDAAEVLRKRLRLRVFEMRGYGMTFDAIATELSIAETSAREYFKVACSEYGRESAEQHLARANSRFDEQVRTLKRAEASLRFLAQGRRSADNQSWEVEPDLEASSVLTSNLRAQAFIVKEQAKMNGAYAPEKVDHRHAGADGGPIKVTMGDLEEALTAARANRADAPTVVEPEATRH